MDTSIRLYTTNSRWGSSTEDEPQGHSGIPVSADEDRCEGLVDKEEENAETSSSEPSSIICSAIANRLMILPKMSSSKHIKHCWEARSFSQVRYQHGSTVLRPILR